MSDDYYGDVTFDVWLRGGDPDRVDRDRVQQRLDDGFDADSCAAAEMRLQRRRRESEPDDREYEE